MDVLDVVVKECIEKVDQLKDHLATGSVKSYEEYQRICGQITGLLSAMNYALSLKQNLEQSDE